MMKHSRFLCLYFGRSDLSSATAFHERTGVYIAVQTRITFLLYAQGISVNITVIILIVIITTYIKLIIIIMIIICSLQCPITTCTWLGYNIVPYQHVTKQYWHGIMSVSLKRHRAWRCQNKMALLRHQNTCTTSFRRWSFYSVKIVK